MSEKEVFNPSSVVIGTEEKEAETLNKTPTTIETTKHVTFPDTTEQEVTKENDTRKSGRKITQTEKGVAWTAELKKKILQGVTKKYKKKQPTNKNYRSTSESDSEEYSGKESAQQTSQSVSNIYTPENVKKAETLITAGKTLTPQGEQLKEFYKFITKTHVITPIKQAEKADPGEEKAVQTQETDTVIVP